MTYSIQPTPSSSRLPAKDQILPVQVGDKTHSYYVDKGYSRTTLTYHTLDLEAHVVALRDQHPPAGSVDALMKEVWEKRATGKPLTQKEKHEMAAGFTPRPDITATHTFEPKSGLAFADTARLTTRHTFARNSEFEGRSYVDESGKVQTLTGVITPSQDRAATRTQMMRRVSFEEGNETIAYTGRPDTVEKAQEQAEFIFRNEFAKGNLIPDRKGVYTLTYLVDSLLSNDRLTPDGKNQRTLFANERKALEELSQNEFILIRVGEKNYKVKCKPILFSHIFNDMSLCLSLPRALTGLSEQKAITKKGIAELKELIAGKLTTLPKEGRDYHILANYTHKLDHFFDLKPEEQCLYLTILTKAAGLPHVFHCKSSKDRTGIAIAIASSLRQWEKRHDTIDYEHLLENEGFKELFASNLMVAHQVTRYGIGSTLDVTGQQLQDIMGLELGSNLIAARLLPKRYLDYSKLRLIGNVALKFTVGILLAALAEAVVVLDIGRNLLKTLVIPFIDAYLLYKGEELLPLPLQELFDDFLDIFRSLLSFTAIDAVARPLQINKKAEVLKDRKFFKVKKMPVELSQTMKEKADELNQIGKDLGSERLVELAQQLKTGKGPIVSELLQLSAEEQKLFSLLAHNIDKFRNPNIRKAFQELLNFPDQLQELIKAAADNLPLMGVYREGFALMKKAEELGYLGNDATAAEAYLNRCLDYADPNVTGINTPTLRDLARDPAQTSPKVILNNLQIVCQALGLDPPSDAPIPTLMMAIDTALAGTDPQALLKARMGPVIMEARLRLHEELLAKRSEVAPLGPLDTRTDNTKVRKGNVKEGALDPEKVAHAIYDDARRGMHYVIDGREIRPQLSEDNDPGLEQQFLEKLLTNLAPLHLESDDLLEVVSLCRQTLLGPFAVWLLTRLPQFFATESSEYRIMPVITDARIPNYDPLLAKDHGSIAIQFDTRRKTIAATSCQVAYLSDTTDKMDPLLLMRGSYTIDLNTMQTSLQVDFMKPPSPPSQRREEEGVEESKRA